MAPHYDELMRAIPYQMWVGYYLLLLSTQEVKPTTLLDICCGTGTMCRLLSDEGKEPFGIDLSPGMIQVAREKAAKGGYDRLEFEVADASNFDLHRKFDAAYSFFDSLNNITDPTAFKRALSCAAKHIKPGGSFIFDLNTAYAFEQKMFDQENLKPGKRLRYKWVGDYDPKARLIQVDMHFWNENEEFHEVHVQRAYTDEEVQDWLAEVGFTQIKAYHSYTLTPPRKKSDRIHYTCIRT